MTSETIVSSVGPSSSRAEPTSSGTVCCTATSVHPVLPRPQVLRSCARTARPRPTPPLPLFHTRTRAAAAIQLALSSVVPLEHDLERLTLPQIDADSIG